MTTTIVFPSGTFAGPFASEGHHKITPPILPSFGTVDKGSTFGGSKTTGKKLLEDKPDSPKSGISRGATPEGLRVGQVKMDMAPIFSTSR